MSQQTKLDSRGCCGKGLKSIMISLSGSLNNAKLYNRTHSLMAEINKNHFAHWQAKCLLIYPASAIAKQRRCGEGGTRVGAAVQHKQNVKGKGGGGSQRGQGLHVRALWSVPDVVRLSPLCHI